MAVIEDVSTPRRTCACGSPSRPGQRTCKVCHSDHMRDYRRRQARETVRGYVDLRNFLDYRDGVVKKLFIDSVLGRKKTPVKITILCKNPKPQ